MQNGAETKMTWTTKSVTNLTDDYGDDWVFGKYLKQEPDWLLAVYKSVEDSGR